MKNKLPRKALCLNCGKYTRYFIGIRTTTLNNISYSEKIGFCRKCHREVDVPGIWDLNMEAIAIIKGIEAENKREANMKEIKFGGRG